MTSKLAFTLPGRESWWAASEALQTTRPGTGVTQWNKPTRVRGVAFSPECGSSTMELGSRTASRVVRLPSQAGNAAPAHEFGLGAQQQVGDRRGSRTRDETPGWGQGLGTRARLVRLPNRKYPSWSRRGSLPVPVNPSIRPGRRGGPAGLEGQIDIRLSWSSNELQESHSFVRNPWFGRLGCWSVAVGACGTNVVPVTLNQGSNRHRSNWRFRVHFELHSELHSELAHTR